MISDTNKEKIKAIVLTPEELEAAIYEGKVKKYFHEKNKHYWITQDCDLKTVKDYEHLPDNTRL